MSGRPWTPRVHKGSTTTVTVKRDCNGCGRTLGDASDAELFAAMNGNPLPDVRDELADLAAVAGDDDA